MGAEPRVCVSCDTPLPPDARFCLSCGVATPVGAEVAASGSSAAEVARQLGAALVDRYTIEQELGRGGMAVVFLARDQKLGRTVALKVLRPELAVSIGTDRFLREIEIAAGLTHPNILPLHDCGEAGGMLYYTMPYLTGESLRDRLHREGQLPIEDALQITREVADALGYAHEQGVVHRDIKPENILLQDGHALVADFGIARAVTAAGTATLTETGLAVGTPVYMSPEQSVGNTDIDGRSDLYSLGCVLYEMLGGETPYLGATPQAVMAKKLTEPIPRISVVRETVPASLEAVLIKVLAKLPVDRYATARQLAQALTGPAVTTPAPFAPAADRPIEPARAPRPLGRGRSLLRPRVIVPAVALLLAAAFLGIRFVQHRADIRWATDVALPEITRLLDANDAWRNLVEPYRLAERAEAVLGDDARLAALFAQIARRVDVRTEPPGARVSLKEYEHPEAEWELLGVTPLEQVRVPIGIFRWKIEKEGYETVLAAASSWDLGGGEELIGRYNLVRTLDEEGSLPPGMVRVEATDTPVGRLDAFFIGKFEVTNREYKAFVDAGGYRNPAYWTHPIVHDGRRLTEEEAWSVFVDQTGQPGPMTWVGGDYPEGQGDYPVSGVSWYEAAAYAAYAGMSLPTSEHWDVARGGFTPMIQAPQLGGFGVLAPFTNFGREGPVAVGSLPGITAYGAYDMPGNVREWCWNEIDQGRVMRGGAWGDNTYEFEREGQAPPMDRSPRNGFRLAFYPDPAEVPEAAFEVRTLRWAYDVRSQEPASDAAFQVYREQFAYDPTPLDAEVEQRAEHPEGWVHETIAFDAAYGGERVRAHLFLPANTPPPYQTVVYFPGDAARLTGSSEEMEHYYEFTMFLSFLVRNGRAVLFPVYKGTFERGSPELTVATRMANSNTHAYTEYLIQTVQDLRRSVDYLETRPEIDTERLAYYGMSRGAVLGSIILAVEPRFEVGVLIGGGLTGRGRPEVLDVSYATRVRTPTLVLNGKYDVLVPLESSARPMFDLLGTPEADKKLILYETDHIPPRTEYIRETLAWLDRYLGPVVR